MKSLAPKRESSALESFANVKLAPKRDSLVRRPRKVLVRFTRFAFAAIAVSALGVPPAVLATTYEIDPHHSTVAFAVKHMLINTVRGTFKQFMGVIQLDESDLTRSSVTVTIEGATIDTGFPRRDDDLRGPSFLDVAKFPEISFVSTRVEKHAENFILVGSLTMHGVAREVRIPFAYNGKATDQAGVTRIGMEGGLVINRQDWGISYNKVLDNGGLVAANEVQIQLDVEAKKK
jgi:polyisoprenoid-binding protein YceI